MFVSFCYSKIDFYNLIFFFYQTSLSFPYHFFFLGTLQFLFFLWVSPLLLSDIFASESLFWESQDTFLGDATDKGGSDFADGSCSLIPCLSIQVDGSHQTAELPLLLLCAVTCAVIVLICSDSFSFRALAAVVCGPWGCLQLLPFPHWAALFSSNGEAEWSTLMYHTMI